MINVSYGFVAGRHCHGVENEEVRFPHSHKLAPLVIKVIVLNISQYRDSFTVGPVSVTVGARGEL
jgi:hypothetical protein